ncbi:MAG: glutamyl-tRNA reductase [Tissierellia bacterium]|nr:glutamyl-tRNA reductase [Tissierellia bacterium]
MKFCIIGVNQELASIDLIEKLHFKETDIIEVSDALQSDTLKEILILSTCNRSEIYFLSEDYKNDIEKVKNYLCDYFKIDIPISALNIKYGDLAIRHLFEVAIGYNSVVIGEDQILGQIVEAHMTAMEIGGSKKFLNKLFREAITFAKQLKAETAVSENPISIAYIGVKKLESKMDLANKNIMIIGLGEMGKLALKSLKDRDANIFVCNRTYNNSLKMKKEFPYIEIIPFEKMILAIENMDIIISATGSPHTILKYEDLSSRTDPLYIMDLSLPRDIDPKIENINSIELYNIESLKSISDKNLKERLEKIDSYLPKIDEKISELQNWQMEAKVDPIMKSANERCDEIADDTLNYIYRKTDMSHNEKKKVDKIVRSALKKVMREPILAVKRMPDSEDKNIAVKILDEVFSK